VTDEDFDCWLWVMQKWRVRHGLAGAIIIDASAREQDRREAVLMNWAVRRRRFLREMGYRLNIRHLAISDEWQQWGGQLG
jgi:hypothetical protein